MIAPLLAPDLFIQTYLTLPPAAFADLNTISRYFSISFTSAYLNAVASMKRLSLTNVHFITGYIGVGSITNLGLTVLNNDGQVCEIAARLSVFFPKPTTESVDATMPLGITYVLVVENQAWKIDDFVLSTTTNGISRKAFFKSLPASFVLTDQSSVPVPIGINLNISTDGLG